MKLFRMLILLVAFTCITNVDSAMAENKFKTDVDSVAYIMGIQLASFMNEDAKTMNIELLKEGIKDHLAGKNQLDGTDINKLMQDYQGKKVMEVAITNLDKGNKFLAENKVKEGVKATASGLQYLVLTEGTGKSPLATEKVKVHYTGTLIDGTVFDSSVERGEPIEFPLNGVIKGWTEGLQLMKVGAKYRFFIPAELAYGERGSQGAIGPNETLIFDVELLAIPVDTPPVVTPGK